MSSISTQIRTSNDGQKRLINWFAKQNNEIKLKIFEEKRKQFFKLKQEIDKNVEVIDYLSFISSIKVIHEKLNYKNKKNKSKSLNELVDISTLELASLKKSQKKEKYEAIVNRYSIIEKLRNENISWRNISQIFKVKYRLNLSHQYIKCVYEELEDGL